jgi:hypothetical protein
LLLLTLLGCATSTRTSSDQSGAGAPKPTPYLRAQELLGRAGQAAAAGDRALANRLLVEGVDALGDLYATDDAIDDTGLHWVACQDLARRDPPGDDVACRRGVLTARLQACERNPACAR